MDEWEDIAIGPPANVSPSIAVGGGDEWEDIAIGPTVAPRVSLGNEVLAVGNRAVEGVADLADFAQNVNPFNPGGPSLFGMNPFARGESAGDAVKKAAEVAYLYGPEKATTTAGKIASEVGYYLPSAAIPGGTIPARIASATGAGGLSAIAEMFGASETGRTIAAVAGSLSPAALGPIGRMFSSGAKAVAPSTAEQAAIKSLGLTPSKIGKLGGVEKVEDIVDLAVQKNVFAGAGPDEWAAANRSAIKALGDETTDFLQRADAVQKNVTFPKWKYAKEFIDENPYQREQLAEQFQRRFETINDQWDGSVSGLNRLKSQLYDIAYSGGTESKRLDRAIARDIKEAVEEQVGTLLGPDAKMALAAKNAEQGAHITISDAIEAAANRAASEELKGPRKLSLLSTPVLGAGGGLASIVAGDPTPAAVILGGVAAKHVLNSSALRGATAGVMGGVGAGAQSLSGVAPAVTGYAGAAEVGRRLSAQAEAIEAGRSQDPRTSQLSDEINKRLEATRQTARARTKISKGTPSPNSTAITDAFQPRKNSAITEAFRPMGRKEDIAAVESMIDSDAYFSALYETESGRNPDAKNPKSSASGGFQFVKATAKSLGLDDPFDLAKSFEAVQTLTDQHRARFGDDPILLYSAHYLGAPLLSKIINGAKLTEKEQALADSLYEKALPRFKRIYDRVSSKLTEA